MTTTSGPGSFGEWVRARRRQLDLTQDELGRQAACSAAAIRKIEAGERKPSRELAQTLAAALGIPVYQRQAFLQMARGVYSQELSHLSGPAPTNLPVQLTSTIDRARDLAAVSALIAQENTHLVTLIGPPGIGKTRLSILCGQKLLPDFPDGVWFVDLAEISSPDFFVSALARTLPTPGLQPNPDLPQLINRLRNRHLLLLLDNFEHIVEGASLDAAKLLKGCPNLKILATSRIPLHIYGEHEYPVPTLSVPPPTAGEQPKALLSYESVQLFVERVCLHQPDFAVTAQNASPIVNICRTLDGIPLALELAAASLHQMTLNELDRMLHGAERGSWIQSIGTPARDLPNRQRTLENVVAWSYDLLSESQQVLLCRLAIFLRWFDTQATAEICFADHPLPAAEVRSQLESLEQHSLLTRGELDGQPCWRMLAIIREFAGFKLGSSAHEALEPLRAGHFLRRIQDFHQDDSLQAMGDFFELNAANLHASLTWAIAHRKDQVAIQLALPLERFWSRFGYLREGLRMMQDLLQMPISLPPAQLAEILQLVSDLAWQQHDFETGLTYARQAAQVGQDNQLHEQYPWFLHRLGRIYIEKGELEPARRTLEQTLALASAEPDKLPPALPLAQLGEIALFEGRYEESQALLLQALEVMPPGEDIFIAMAHTDLAEISLAREDGNRARIWLEKAIEPASRHIRRMLVFLCALAGYLLWKGDVESLQQAAQIYGAIDALAEHSGIIFSPFYQDQIEMRTRSTHRKLSPQVWEAAYANGRQWSQERVVAQAKSIFDLDH